MFVLQVVLLGQRSRSVGLTPPRGMTPQDYFRRGIRPISPESAEDPLLDGGLVNNLYEWRLNLQTGETTERTLSDWKVSGDFPRVNESYLGRRTKYGYVAVHDIDACIEKGASTEVFCSWLSRNLLRLQRSFLRFRRNINCGQIQMSVVYSCQVSELSN